jgi:hypothetical protein
MGQLLKLSCNGDIHLCVTMGITWTAVLKGVSGSIPGGGRWEKNFYNMNKNCFFFQVRQNKTKHEIKGNTVQLLQNSNQGIDP